jgi:hypothetical protein
MAIPRGKPCPGLHASGNTGMGSQMTSCFVGHYWIALLQGPGLWRLLNRIYLLIIIIIVKYGDN